MLVTRHGILVHEHEDLAHGQPGPVVAREAVVERLWIDAAQEGEAWLWRGTIAADDPRLDVLTGPRSVEATVPGAGSLRLNGSQRPAEFISRCAGEITPPPAPEASPE